MQLESISHQILRALTDEHPRHEWHLWDASYYHDGGQRRFPRGTWLCHCGAKKRVEHRGLKQGVDVSREEFESEAEFEALVRQAEAVGE